MKVEAGEMAPWTKHMPLKLEDQDLGSQHPHTCCGWPDLGTKSSGGRDAAVQDKLTRLVIWASFRIH